MTTNKTIKRMGKLVAGLAVTGSTMMSLGGGCQADWADAGGVGAMVGQIQKERMLSSEIEAEAAQKMQLNQARWILQHNETLVRDEA